MPSSGQAPAPGSSKLNVAAGGIDNRTENDKARLREPYQESGPGNVDYGFSWARISPFGLAALCTLTYRSPST
jgi:hypothetical protein